MKAKTATINLTIDLTLAKKIFGLYVHGAKDNSVVDLSVFKSWMSFMSEITNRLPTLTKEEQIFVIGRLTEEFQNA